MESTERNGAFLREELKVRNSETSRRMVAGDPWPNMDGGGDGVGQRSGFSFHRRFLSVSRYLPVFLQEQNKRLVRANSYEST
jgi:hypothetical protein